MSSLHIRFAAKPAKILVAGALLAASAAGCAVSGASAADIWTATTAPIAAFECVSDDCSAGGVGPVLKKKWVNTNDPSDSKIGAWSRTVAIHCKIIVSGGGTLYRVEVRDTNWSGLWHVHKQYMTNAVDDTSFPTCN